MGVFNPVFSPLAGESSRRRFDPYPDALLALDFAGVNPSGRPFYKREGMVSPRFEMMRGASSVGGAGFGTALVNGVYETFAPNTPLIGDGGLGIWEARTNSIRNPVMAGATVGAPGTFPTNWINDGNLPFFARQIVGVGYMSNGLPYIDIRYSGVASNTFGNVLFEPNTSTPALNGQTWTSTYWAALLAGSLPGITPRNNIFMRSNTGSFIAAVSGGPFVPLTSELTRTTAALTLNSAEVAFVNSALTFTGFTVGQSYDFTLRIAAPNLKLGADINDPPILQTSGLSATRTTVAPMVGGLVLPSGGFTVIATQGAIPNMSGTFPRMFSLSNSDNSVRVGVLRFGTNGNFAVTNSGGGDVFSGASTFGRGRCAVSCDGTNIRISVNGTTSGFASRSINISALGTLVLQNSRNLDRPGNSDLEDLRILPYAMTTAELQAASAL